MATVIDQAIVTQLMLGIFVLVGVLYLIRRNNRRRIRRQLLQQLADLEALQSASNAIVASALDVDALCALIAAECGKVIDNNTFQIGLFEPNSYRVVFWRVNGALRETPIFITGTGGLLGWVRDKRKHLLITDFERESESLPAKPRYLSDNPPRSGLFLPLISGEEVIGIVTAQHPQPNQFRQEDVQRLSILANQAAAAIENAQLYVQAQQRAEALESVNAIARQANLISDPYEIFHQVVTVAHQQLGFHPVTIWSIENDEIVNEASSVADLERGTICLSLNDGLLGKAVQSRQVVVANDVEHHPDYRRTIDSPQLDEIVAGTQAEIAIPLLFDDELLGVLDVQSQRVGGFSAHEQTLLLALSNEVAAAIGKAKKNAIQQEQAWVASAQYQVADALSAHRSLDAVLDAVTRVTMMVVGAEQCGVLLWDGAVYRPKIINGTTLTIKQHFTQTTLPIGRWGALDAVHVGHERLTTSHPPPWQANSDPLTLLPLTAEDQLLGILFVQLTSVPNQQAHARRDEILANIAYQTAQRVESLQLRQAQQEEAWVTAALFQVAEAVNNSVDLNEILNIFVRTIPMFVGVQTCVILIWDEKANSFQLGASYGLSEMGQGLIASFNFDETEFLSLRPAADSDLTQTTTYHAHLPLWMADVMGEDSAEIVPLHARNQLVGALVVGATSDGEPLVGRRHNILLGIAQQVAIAVVNDGLYRESAERERLARELDVARQIQANMLPNGTPDFPNCTIASYWGAAQQVSGDFYDFIKLPTGEHAIAIADVAGKGVPAAIFMVLCRTVLRAVALSPQALPPHTTLKRVNRILLNDSASEMFVTLFYAVWNEKNRHISFVNGGHNPPLILRANGMVEVVGRYGIALGIIEDIPFRLQRLPLNIGDTILFYTDGVTEAMNVDHTPFGLPRLESVLRQLVAAEPQTIINTIRDAIQSHADGMLQSDDVTMVVMRCDA